MGLGIIYKVKISALYGVISIYLCACLAAAWYYCLHHKIAKNKKIKEIRLSLKILLGSFNFQLNL